MGSGGEIVGALSEPVNHRPVRLCFGEIVVQWGRHETKRGNLPVTSRDD